MRRLLERVAHEERGAVIVTVVGFLPVAIGLAAFVIDVGNGMEHRRHLQLQADAGALAAAPEFNGCRNDPDAANEAIRQKAIEYASDKNAQIGGEDAQSRVRAVINGTGYDAADYSDGGPPCTTGFVDVKLTEDDSPAFFGFVGSHDYRGHARLQIFNARVMDGLLPLAVPAPDPRKVVATFIDETTGLALKDANGNDIVAPLEPTGLENGLATWETADADQDPIAPQPVEVPIDSDHVGIRIALSGGSSTDCAAALVTCYDEGSANGLLHIQGWSSTGTVDQRLPDGPQDPPLVRSVRLEPGAACEDAYFSSSSKPCDQIGVTAIVDFGGNPTAVGGKLTATVSGKPYALTYDPTTGEWTTGTVVPIAADAGPIDVTLDWRETKGKVAGTDCTKGQGCKASFGIVQRHFSATSDRSGPIELAEVSEGGTDHANSLEKGTHSLNIKIGIAGTLELAAPNSTEPQYMRIAGDSGSQTQALDCNANGAGDFRWEMVLGCTALYAEHQGAAPWAPCPPDVSGMAQPWQCVEVTTGDRTNNPAAALNERILGNSQPDVCPGPGELGHNNWPNYPANDPRKVSVFLTRFNAFEGEGNFTVPITGFATFYITGWTSSGGGFANPCQEPGNGDEIPRDAGEIVGRYIPSVETPNEGGGQGSCTFEAINPCTAVLVD